MRIKILTVDDSKTVRIIIRKAFKPFDCEIFEAANGVEGLAVAGKELPDIILLDITMPVMDGVEMLTKLKADPQLKAIPVMMLTAEGGRENVLRIAKIGIRDYIIKPFKEHVLLDKVGRIIDLKPIGETTSKVRSILDPADILIVEDKPAIVQQIQEGLKHTNWKIRGVNTQGEAIDCCSKQTPDLVIVSLSLPQEAAFTLFRTLRASSNTKYTPVFGLVVKTETAVQDAAQQMGITAVVTKPIDPAELESKIAKAMNLDMSLRYFETQGEFLVIMFPENSTPAVLVEVNNYLSAKFSEAVDSGINKAIVDLHCSKTLHMGLIKLLMVAMKMCKDLAVNFALVGNSNIATECKAFEDTRDWVFYDTMEEAKSNLGKPASTPAAGNTTPDTPQLATA